MAATTVVLPLTAELCTGHCCVLPVQDKFLRLVPSIDDARQRLAFDIPAADLRSIYGYPAGAPDLVLSNLDR